MIQVKIPKLEQFERAFANGEAVLVKLMNKAMRKSLAHLTRNMKDGGDSYHFKFKTPRKDRTGFLAKSLRLKTAEEMSRLARNPRSLTAVTYSQMEYANKVAKNNPFYERITKATQSEITQSFNEGLEEASHNIFKGL